MLLLLPNAVSQLASSAACSHDAVWYDEVNAALECSFSGGVSTSNASILVVLQSIFFLLLVIESDAHAVELELSSFDMVVNESRG